MTTRFTKAELKEAVTTIYAKLTEGKEDKEILEEMGLSAEDFDGLKRQMFDMKADELRGKPVEHVYVEYMVNQIQNVKDLTTMVKDFKSSKQYNAMVGAIRARADIYDKLIDRGQSLGVIKREPTVTKVIGGILVGELTNVQLKEMITKELGELNRLMRRYGDKGIIDMDPGSLHYGEALPVHGDTPEGEATSPVDTIKKVKAISADAGGFTKDDPRPKHFGARTAKVSGGRKVVKT